MATAVAYTRRTLDDEKNSDSLVIARALSGGGYRVAAMAHAEMTQLCEAPTYWKVRHLYLLDEVDFISAVAGSTLAADYFSLKAKQFARDLESRVLFWIA